MQHGLDAAGARYQRPGFAWTAEQDLRWALGWPHMTTLGDEAVADPAAAALAILDGGSTATVPREVAHRLIRLLATASPENTAGTYVPTKQHLTVAAKAGVPTEKDLRALIKNQLTGYQHWGNSTVSEWLFVLEAVFGPERSLETFLDELDRRSRRQLEKADCRLFLPATLHCAGYVLLRVHRESEPALRQRLVALHEKFSEWANNEYDWSSVVTKLSLVLGGAAAAVRANTDGRLGLREHEFVFDDPALIDDIATRVTPKVWTPDPVVRLCFLGTEKVIDSYATRWQKLDKQEAFFREISEVQSPKVIEILLEIAVKSKVKKAAAAWFAAHPERGRDHLKRTAREKTPAAHTAAKILASLG